MEYGNIGNFYIVDPMFRELRNIFPNDCIMTTMQFSDEFCEKYNIQTIPLSIYYDFNSKNNLDSVKNEYNELKASLDFYHSEYVDLIRESDLVIDFSGDIWGDNADYISEDRFMVGLYRDMIAQLLKPTILFSVSPGPFSDDKPIDLIKEVYSSFDLVICREAESYRSLRSKGFDIDKTHVFSCPSFIFSPDSKKVEENRNDVIGMCLCGWNFFDGGYVKWPREESEYNVYVDCVEALLNNSNVNIEFFSHSNGFIIPPATFKLTTGRDFPIIKQLYEILKKRGYSDRVKLIEYPQLPYDIWNRISSYDMLISGRMHGAVAGISQSIPTVIIDYGQGPKANKLKGYAEMAGMSDYLVDPHDSLRLNEVILNCYNNRKDIHNVLNNKMREVKKNSKEQFRMIGELLS
jgi:colanic acid/amylovoran biosynthesis protein